MASVTGIATLAPISRMAHLEQQLRRDRRTAALLARDSRRLRELGSTLLETDGRASEMFADAETLVAYLRALTDKWRRRPPDKSGAPRRRSA